MCSLLHLRVKSSDTIAVIAIAVIAQYSTVAVTANALMANTIAVIASAVKVLVVEACGSAWGLKLFETSCFKMFKDVDIRSAKKLLNQATINRLHQKL